MIMCIDEINTYFGLKTSLRVGKMSSVVVKTNTDGSRAKQGRPSLGLYWSVINKPSSTLDKHKQLRET